MRKTRQMVALEQQNGGRPIKQLIADALKGDATLQEAADSLGVKLPTLYGWMTRLRIERRRIVIVEGQEVA